MSTRSASERARLGLIGLAIAALLIVLLLSLERRDERGGGCASPVLATPREEPHGPPALGEVELAPVPPAAAPEGHVPRPQAPKPPPAAITATGCVIDARTGEPVPWVDVELTVGDVHWSGRTDTAGNFASTAAFASGEMTVRVKDDDVLVARQKVLWPSPFLRVAVPIGPTVLVTSIGDRAPLLGDSFALCIVQSARGPRSAGEIDVRDDELRVAEPEDVRWSERPLRFESLGPFARWPRVEHEPIPDTHVLVEVRATNDLERGTGEIARVVGTQSAGHVATDRYFLVSGLLRGARGHEMPNARVLFRPTGDARGKGTRRRFDRVECASTDGTCSAVLAQGVTYTAVCWADDYEPMVWERWFDDKRGDSYRLKDLTLSPVFGPAFDSPGRVLVDEIGPADAPQFVRARAVDAERAEAVVFAWPGGAGRASGTILRTRYEVELVGVNRAPVTGGVSWKQILPWELALPADKVAKRIVHHRIESTDPLLGSARPILLVTAGPDGPIVTTKPFPDGSRWSLVEESAMHFTAWIGGCEPVDVRARDFATEDGERVARVVPRPGWGVGIAFRIVEPTPADPKAEPSQATRPGGARHLAEWLALPSLPGVKVSAAIGELGVSDAEGWVLVRARLWPPRLSLVAPGWRLRELQRLDGGGSRWLAFMEREGARR